MNNDYMFEGLEMQAEQENNALNGQTPPYMEQPPLPSEGDYNPDAFEMADLNNNESPYFDSLSMDNQAHHDDNDFIHDEQLGNHEPFYDHPEVAPSENFVPEQMTAPQHAPDSYEDPLSGYEHYENNLSGHSNSATSYSEQEYVNEDMFAVNLSNGDEPELSIDYSAVELEQGPEPEYQPDPLPEHEVTDTESTPPAPKKQDPEATLRAMRILLNKPEMEEDKYQEIVDEVIPANPALGQDERVTKKAIIKDRFEEFCKNFEVYESAESNNLPYLHDSFGAQRTYGEIYRHTGGNGKAFLLNEKTNIKSSHKGLNQEESLQMAKLAMYAAFEKGWKVENVKIKTHNPELRKAYEQAQREVYKELRDKGLIKEDYEQKYEPVKEVQGQPSPLNGIKEKGLDLAGGFKQKAAEKKESLSKKAKKILSPKNTIKERAKLVKSVEMLSKASSVAQSLQDHHQQSPKDDPMVFEMKRTALQHIQDALDAVSEIEWDMVNVDSLNKHANELKSILNSNDYGKDTHRPGNPASDLVEAITSENFLNINEHNSFEATGVTEELMESLKFLEFNSEKTQPSITPEPAKTSEKNNEPEIETQPVSEPEVSSNKVTADIEVEALSNAMTEHLAEYLEVCISDGGDSDKAMAIREKITDEVIASEMPWEGAKVIIDQMDLIKNHGHEMIENAISNSNTFNDKIEVTKSIIGLANNLTAETIQGVSGAEVYREEILGSINDTLEASVISSNVKENIRTLIDAMEQDPAEAFNILFKSLSEENDFDLSPTELNDLVEQVSIDSLEIRNIKEASFDKEDLEVISPEKRREANEKQKSALEAGKKINKHNDNGLEIN